MNEIFEESPGKEIEDGEVGELQQFDSMDIKYENDEDDNQWWQLPKNSSKPK